MILVTGGTGTAGCEIVSQLAATGTPFRAMVRDPAKALSLRLTGVEIVPGNLSKPGTLAPALKGIDQVMLLSGPNPNQVELEGNMVVAAKTAGIRHIVKFSAMTADPNSHSMFPRGTAKSSSGLETQDSPGHFSGPRSSCKTCWAWPTWSSGGHIYQPAGDSKAGFVDTEDIAAVAVEALTEPGHEGHAYDITGPELLSYHDIARTFSEVLGKPVAYQDVPPGVANRGWSVWACRSGLPMGSIN